MGLIQHMQQSHSQNPNEAVGQFVRDTDTETEDDDRSETGSIAEGSPSPAAHSVTALTPFQLEKHGKKTTTTTSQQKGGSLLHQLASKQQKRRTKRPEVDEETPACDSPDQGSPSSTYSEEEEEQQPPVLKTENVKLFKEPLPAPAKPYRQIASGLDVQIKGERVTAIEYPDTDHHGIYEREPNVFFACPKTNNVYYPSNENEAEKEDETADADVSVVVKKETKVEVDAMTEAAEAEAFDPDDDDDDNFDTRSNSTIDDDEVSSNSSRSGYIRIDISKLLRPCYVPIFRDELAVRSRGKRK